MRHGEVKQLRSMKKDYHMAAPKKKKFLKLNEYYGQGEDFSENEADDENIDIKDVEFRLRNDSRQVKVKFNLQCIRNGLRKNFGKLPLNCNYTLSKRFGFMQDLLHKSAAHGFEDVTMLKVILCSGLYPQFAVTDEHNQYKVSPEILLFSQNQIPQF